MLTLSRPEVLCTLSLKYSYESFDSYFYSILNDFHKEVGVIELSHTLDDSCIYVENIFISEEFRGKGIARKVLTEKLFQIFPFLSSVQLMPLPHLINYYRKLGFRTEQVFTDGDIIMRLDKNEHRK